METKTNQSQLSGQKRTRTSTENKRKPRSKRRKTTKKAKAKNEPTYIVEYLRHDDCHKRAGAETHFVGRYRNYEDAVYIAVTRQLDEVEDEEEWKTYVASKLNNKGFSSYSEIWDTGFYEAWYEEREGTYTPHRCGDYYSITACKHSIAPRKKPVEDYLKEIGIDNQPLNTSS